MVIPPKTLDFSKKRVFLCVSFVIQRKVGFAVDPPIPLIYKGNTKENTFFSKSPRFLEV